MTYTRPPEHEYVILRVHRADGQELSLTVPRLADKITRLREQIPERVESIDVLALGSRKLIETITTAPGGDK